MTQPIEDAPTRRTGSVLLGGTDFLVRELTETQVMHLARHARILMRTDIGADVKLESVDRMFHILHTCVEETQLPQLIALEESGEVSLRDLTGVAKHFKDDEAEKPVVRRRGRPRKSQ
jgi:hypothetical protein